MMGHIFSIVPVEVWLDKRLTLEQLRVLGVLFSFRAKNTDTVWPSRHHIAERCGMHISNISNATSALERLGWLKKEGTGGYSKATRYTIAIPEIPIAESARVAQPATVAESTTRMPLAESATRKEHNQEQTNKNTRAKTARLPVDIPEQLVADYLALRRVKRAPLTQTALDGLMREAAKAGITLQAVLETCCERGWAGFKADWLKASSSQQRYATQQPECSAVKGAV